MAKIGKRALLQAHIESLQAATSADDLEARFQEALKALTAAHGGFMTSTYRSATAKLQREALIPRGRELVSQHPRGNLVPSFDTRTRRLTVGGESYKVSKGGNSTGVRYAWHYANEWAGGVMAANGLGKAAIRQISGVWSGYPHRAISALATQDRGTSREGES